MNELLDSHVLLISQICILFSCHILQMLICCCLHSRDTATYQLEQQSGPCTQSGTIQLDRQHYHMLSSPHIPQISSTLMSIESDEVSEYLMTPSVSQMSTAHLLSLYKCQKTKGQRSK